MAGTIPMEACKAWQSGRNFRRGFVLMGVWSRPLLLDQLLPIDDSLSTFPLPGVCASFETAIGQEFIFR